MKLSDILQEYPCDFRGDLTLEISDICRDSREARPGCLFFCIVGFASDGHDFAGAAVEAGAVALVVSRWLPELDVTQIKVEDDRLAMAVLSANFFGHPAQEMTMVGITGTNGKTTTTYLCAEIARKAGKQVGIIGTICNKIGERTVPTKNTTPESLELQRLLREMADAGVDVVFMEVSSHSLALKRVAGIAFTIGAFTNLSQDHLDFHQTMENYMYAKSILFTQAGISVLNIDDGAFGILSGTAEGEVVSYGIGRRADFQATEIERFSWGSIFMVNGIEYSIKIPGQFSVYNALCAIAICSRLGYDREKIREGLAGTAGIDGRAQVLKDKPYTIILDYAHTPDGLENILKTFEEFGKLTVLFGAGGDRDHQKRPLMGETAGKHADFVILTSDNPRSEEPISIMKEIEKGVRETRTPYVMIENRREAIAYAIDHAAEGEVIILAGKGHETYQEIGGVRYEFDEKKIVEEILKERDEL